MKFTSTFLFSLFVAFVSAVNPNAFNIPAQGYLLNAGQPTTFTWSNPQGSTVTLQLRSGPSGNLSPGVTIVSGLSNTGSFTWNVPSNIVAGNDYAIEIIDDQDTSVINFTPQFTIQSSVVSSSSATPSSTASATTSTSTLASSSSSSSSASGSSTSSSSATVSSTSSVSSASTTASSSTVSIVTAPVTTSVIFSTFSTATGTGAISTGLSGNGSLPTASSPTSTAPFTVATGAAARPMAAGAGLLAAVAALAAAF